MNCRKCSRAIPEDAIFCCYCGVKQDASRKQPKRMNGSGWARKRGRTWTAGIIVGYDANALPETITLGEFSTKSAALDFVPVLKASKAIPKQERNTILRQAKMRPTIDEALFVVRASRKGVSADLSTFKEVYDRGVPFYEPRIDKSTMSGHRAAMTYFKDIWEAPFSQLSADDLQDCIDACPNYGILRAYRESLENQGFAVVRRVFVLFQNTRTSLKKSLIYRGGATWTTNR